ncbi:hypothetical protein J1605_008020 [Eschrichtius robustus]|uniref:Uncharacterized protein n=1 Tax=Eschrichtius robustus TaxID=9764 RepID=A0AB34H1W1_ESCRO|nr:hypothetical protein J1605_008020 [Eschrichtius robustus]
MEEPLCQRTRLVPRDPNTDKQGLVSRERSMRFAGQDSVTGFPVKVCGPKDGKRRPLGLLVCTDSPERVCTLHLPNCPLLVARRRGDANSTLRTCLAWLVMPRARPSSGLGPSVPPALPELLQEAAQRLSS